jgi:hypothetical protein
MDEIWPNFFLVGAAKAGTTSLRVYLSQHPQVFFPRIREPHFFTQVTLSRRQRLLYETVTDRSKYLHLFKGARRFEVVGDASPSYLWHPEVPARIRQLIPDAKIAMILRDPVERAHSHYLMDYREGVENLDFYEALVHDMCRSDRGWGISSLYFELGLYARQVRRYLETFPPHRVMILFFEDFSRDVKRALNDLAGFLHLDSSATDRIDTSKVHNAYAEPRFQFMRRLAGGSIPRLLGQTIVPPAAGQLIFERFFLRRANKPPMDPRAHRLLCELYDPEVSALEKILGRSLPQLRSSWGTA